MKALLLILSTILLSHSANAASGSCTKDEWQQGLCADYTPSQAPKTVPGDIQKPPAVGDKAWYQKAWDFMTFQPSGVTEVKNNVTESEKSPPVRKVRNLPESAGSAEQFEKTFTPEEMKIYAKHNAAIQEVYRAEKVSYEALNKVKAELDPIVLSVASVEKEIQPLALAADKCKADPNGPNCEDWLELAGDQTVRKLGLLRRQKRALEGDLKTAETNFDQKFSNYRDSRTEIDILNQRIKDDRLLLPTQIRDLELSLRRADVRNAFQDSKFGLMTVDHKLDILEREFDKQDIGIYMQAKMGALLTSDILCETTRKCVSREKREFGPEALKELFKELNDTANQRERSRERYQSK